MLAGDEPEPERSGQTNSLAIDLLRPGKYQPRAGMDPAALQELADSIRTQGILQAILVRPLPGGQYEIVAGERRWRAAQLAGLSEVPVTVRDIPDEAALAAALIENIQRENLNPLEEASGIQRLIKEFRMTHESAAQAVGRSRSAVSNLLRLLNLAQPVRELLLANQIDMGHARALLALTPIKQSELAQRIVHQQLSAREAERLVQRELTPAPAQSKAVRDRDVARLEEELAEAIGATVAILSNKKGQGSLTIRFASLAELDGLIARIKRPV